MATGGTEITSDEIPDFQCVSCENRAVAKYCIDCQGYCCRSCVETHSRFPTMKMHTLLDKSEFQTPGSPVKKLPMVPTERCNIHPIKILDMYCADHDVVGCTTCMTLNHRSCSNVHSIPDDIDILFKPSKINEVHQRLHDSKETIGDIRKNKNVLLEELHVSKNEADNSIKNAKREVIAAANRLEKKSLEEVENMYQVIKTSIEKEKKEATEQSDDIERISNSLTASEGNKAQQFVSMKIACKKIAEVKDVELSLNTGSYAKINFTIDPNVEACFRDVKTFGKIKASSSVEERTEIYKVDKCSDMNVKLSADSATCQIFGSCLTEDGSLLLADYNNMKLKRANIKTMTVDGYCNFDIKPRGVCCTSRQVAVVTFYSDADSIQFVSLGNHLTPSRKVKISHFCLGIACKEDKLYITDNSKTVYIHDLVGNQLQAISHDSFGKNLFGCTRHNVFNDAGHGIIVADVDYGVIILNGQYQHEASFNDSELTSATGVCTDRRGNIFVCGYGSHNVLQIGYDGKKRGVVISKADGVYTPYSVCLDTLQCKLIVTQNNDIVKIFDLK